MTSKESRTKSSGSAEMTGIAVLFAMLDIEIIIFQQMDGSLVESSGNSLAKE